MWKSEHKGVKVKLLGNGDDPVTTMKKIFMSLLPKLHKTNKNILIKQTMNKSTLTFDRETFDFYVNEVIKAKASNSDHFIHKGSLVKIGDAETLITRLQAAFNREPESEIVTIPA